MGKTSLINQAFGVDLVSNLRWITRWCSVKIKTWDVNGGIFQPVSHELPSEHRIGEPIPTRNKMFTLHDSEGFERLQSGKCDVVHNFIKQRLEGESGDRLHAIWYVRCSDAPRQSNP